MNNLDQYNFSNQIQQKIEHNDEITRTSLEIVVDSAQAIIPNIATMKSGDIQEQLEAIKEFLSNAEAAIQRKMALKNILAELNNIN